MTRSGFALALALAGAAFTHSPASAAGDVNRGRAAFATFGCWQCHGLEGQGSVATSNGKRLAPDPLPWETFSSFVRTSTTTMPPYSEKVLSNGDLEDIHAFLSSIGKPKDYKSIPLLNP